MESSRHKAVRAHRSRRKALGVVRVEVQAPESDVPLIRSLAAALRDDPVIAGRVRAQVRNALQPPQQINLLEMLSCELPDDVPDDVVDEALERPRDLGRDIRL
ncbi:MAG: hypothetical protein IPM60_01165 [Rhodospirillales bacterium]|nr:hypothetical protein [Rhodospirillales bacterium]